MKRILFLSLLLLLTGILPAQQTLSLGHSQQQIDVKTDRADGLWLSIQYDRLTATTSDGFSELSLAEGFFDGEVGQPKLPVTQRFLEIPFGAEVQVTVKSYTKQAFDLNDYGLQRLTPVQAPVSKDDNPADQPLAIDEQVYAKDEFLGQPLASVQVLGTLRGYHIAKLTVAPVTYNPVREKIEVYNDIELEINYLHPDLALTQEIKAKTYSPYFDYLQDYFLNRGLVRDYPSHPDLTHYPIKYVIVADRMFEGYLDAFVKWKTQKGFQVILSYTDEIGNTFGAIQSYLHGLYNNATSTDPAPSFILFVGDTPQIPASIGQASQKVTDLYYASVDGDYFPEMYYGRFSAQSPDQLMPQIEKTLYYEQYQFIDPSYLNRATLIAGWDDYWNAMIAQPTIQYGLNSWFNEDHGYDEVYPYFSPTDYEGCYEDDKISVSMINYTAHCSETVWGTPALSSSTINSMHNEGFYPVAIGNCCESSQFAYGECVGETWVRADKKGAVCYIGSAPSTYWYEDAWWAMGSYHITNANLGQAPQYSQTTMGSYDAMHEGGYVSAGGLVYCGNLAVTESCNQGWSDAARYYWEAYNVLGDPSLVSYHTEGTDNTVSHDPVLFRGVGTFSLEAEPGSYVGLSKEERLLGYGLVGESGELTLQIDPVDDYGFAELVVTRPQRKPYHVSIPLATLGEPFLVVSEVEPAQLEYNEETALSVTVKNVGDSPVPAGTTIMLSSVDDRMVVTSAQATVGQEVLVGGTVLIPNAFRVMADVDVYDQERFRLLTLADCGDHVNADFYLTVNKPVFEYLDYDWTGGFMSGGVFDLEVSFQNIGGGIAQEAVAKISSDNAGITFASDAVSMGAVGVGESVTCRFTVFVNESVSEGEMLQLTVALTAAGVEESQTIDLFNTCGMTLELRDAGGNGWEGAKLKILFEDSTPQMQFTLTEGSLATYEFSSRKGCQIRLSWTKGSNDGECSFTLSYDDGEVVYESGPNLQGNLLTTPVNCTITATEVAEQPEASQLSVYPNPASHQVTVATAQPMSRCLLLNSLGQVVMDRRVNEDRVQLDVNHLAPGIYLLKAFTVGGEATQRIMVR